MSVLDKILENKRQEVEAAKQQKKLDGLKRQAQQAKTDRRNFTAALSTAAANQQTAIIAELKQASPSAGKLTANYNPAELAQQYEAGGAACLSVLTDSKYFQGSPEHLRQARSATALPVLRKDFIIDTYQVWESAAMGADAILLIAAALTSDDLTELLAESQEAGMTILLECHTAEEINANKHHADREDVLLGINTRNLNTLEVSPAAALENIRIAHIFPALAQRAVLESGITQRDQIEAFRTEFGIARFLVGTALMQADDPAAALRTLRGTP